MFLIAIRMMEPRLSIACDRLWKTCAVVLTPGYQMVHRAMHVAVIGGVLWGLLTLKYLLSVNEFLPIKPIEALLFEAEQEMGGTFRYRSYEDAEVCVFASALFGPDSPTLLPR